MKPIVFFDPHNGQHYHEYLTKIWFKGLGQYLLSTGKPMHHDNVLEKIRNSTVLVSADYLNKDTITALRTNGCKIVAFSCTDSSYISQSCRGFKELREIDLVFALTGIQKINEGHEFVVDKDFNVSLEKRQFLPEDDWFTFDAMRRQGRIQSLPYVHWSRLPEQPVRPYSQRSQKVVMRGGLHARRYILSLFLMRHGLLDPNSGFVTAPYFADSMRPEFRYCGPCRQQFKQFGRYPRQKESLHWRTDCTSSAKWGHDDWTLDLGQWNNRCPESFYWLAQRFAKKHGDVYSGALEDIVNAKWLTAEAHQELLGRITFTSDLKWLFSIYAAQRFWDAAAAGCINVLPGRSMDQEYFPVMNNGEHYLMYSEDMEALAECFFITELNYTEVTKAARALYDQWVVPGPGVLNINLCRHIIELIERHCA